MFVPSPFVRLRIARRRVANAVYESPWLRPITVAVLIVLVTIVPVVALVWLARIVLILWAVW